MVHYWDSLSFWHSPNSSVYSHSTSFTLSLPNCQTAKQKCQFSTFSDEKAPVSEWWVGDLLSVPVQRVTLGTDPTLRDIYITQSNNSIFNWMAWTETHMISYIRHYIHVVLEVCKLIVWFKYEIKLLVISTLELSLRMYQQCTTMRHHILNMCCKWTIMSLQQSMCICHGAATAWSQL